MKAATKMKTDAVKPPVAITPKFFPDQSYHLWSGDKGCIVTDADGNPWFIGANGIAHLVQFR